MDSTAQPDEPSPGPWAPPDPAVPPFVPPPRDPYAQRPYVPEQYGRQPYPPPPYQPHPYAYAQPPRRGPWAVPPGPGRPFHQLARTPLHRWWRPPAGLLVGAALAVVVGIALGFAAVGYLVATGQDVGRAGSEDMFGDDTVSLAFNLITLALLIPIVLLVAWLVQRRPPGTVLSVAGRLRWRWLLTAMGLCVVVEVLVSGTTLLLDGVSGGQDPWAGMSGSKLFPAIWVIVLLVPFQAAAEELTFRGWLPQAIGAYTLEGRTGAVARVLGPVLRSPWPGIVVSTALFTAAHAHRGWALADVAMFGAVAGWLAFRTGGLEASIALHVVNNLMAFSLAAASGTLAEADAVTDAPWTALIGTAIHLALYSALVVWFARRGAVLRRTPGEPASAPTPTPTAPGGFGTPGIPGSQDTPPPVFPAPTPTS